ncbi:MAG: hypothetical protein KDB27_19765 [Planctomycetales bacterium]|nr:hypothetical protein [Planctomycetales bacterium]
MNVSAEQLEYVIREVTRRLAEVPEQNPPTQSDETETQLTDRVITVATLKDLPKSISKVTVNTKAIVTPAAIDLLKEKSISLIRRSATAAPAQSGPALVIAQHNCVAAQEITSAIRKSGRNVRFMTIANGEQLGPELRQGEVAVLVTDRPFEATCHANRNSRVCAIYATNEQDCVAAMKETSANVLVVDAKRNNITLVSTFLTAFQGKRG